MESPIKIRAASVEDLPFLKRMLCAAAYWRESGKPDLDVDAALATPELVKLLADWGRTGDCALIAAIDGQPIGAAWYRFWTENNHSYGFVAPEIPELAIGVDTKHRGLGVGRGLMIKLFSAAQEANVTQLSLSVEQDNPALALYKSLGFQSVGKQENSLTMTVAVLEQ